MVLPKSRYLLVETRIELISSSLILQYYSSLWHKEFKLCRTRIIFFLPWITFLVILHHYIYTYLYCIFLTTSSQPSIYLSSTGMPRYCFRPLFTNSFSKRTHFLYSFSFQYGHIHALPTALGHGSSMDPNFFSMKTERTKLVGGYFRSTNHPWRCLNHLSICGLATADLSNTTSTAEDILLDPYLCTDAAHSTGNKQSRKKHGRNKSVVEFSKVDPDKLPTVILVGRPNVGKSALFNRLIRRREALVYNTPDDHVTRDIREGIAKLGDLRFRVLDSAGLEMAASSGSILDRTAEMTGNVIARSQFAIFLIDVRDGLHPMDLEVGKWLRKHASGIRTILAMNKSESLDDHRGHLTSAAGEAHKLGYGDPIAISAETGLGMVDLYESLLPLLEEYMLHTIDDKVSEGSEFINAEESKLPLQLAIVGRPNVGKSTLLNALLQQDRVLVGPEVGLTRDSVRAQFQYQGRTIFLVDTAGWLQRSHQEKGPASLSVMQSRKSLMRAHVIALVLDAEEIVNARSSMKHAEVVIARRAVEEGRSLVVIVNKMDLLRGNQKLYEKVVKAVPEEIQTVIPQVTGIPVVFVSALEGRGRTGVMRQVVNAYEKWCLRLSTARLNRWLRKVMSRHSWKDQASQPKIKYFTQVKARPPTFVAFISGKTQLSDTDIRFLTKSLKEDFDMGGIPIRIMQRCVSRKESNSTKNSQSAAKMPERISSEKRAV